MFRLVDGVPLVQRFYPALPCDNLVPLRDAPWPECVKAEIEEAFAKYGQTHVREVKLVEPAALCFLEGRNVKWEKLTDYFRWEAASLLDEATDPEAKEARRLQRAAMKKYHHQFMHYDVYDPQ